MLSPVAALVEDLISSKVVVIFSKTECSYCKLAKELFDKMQQHYNAFELDQRSDGDAILEVLGKMTGARTLPRVFVNGKCLGGWGEVKALYDNGKLIKYFEE